MRRYPKVTAAAAGALLVATMAQLAVPQFVQRIIDIIVEGVGYQTVLNLPPMIQQVASERLGLDLVSAQSQLDQAPSALVWAGIAIVAFAIARGLFAFAQTYMSQILSHNIAFDLRNDLFAKIQRLSFSYHDRNRTGGLMIRATDDVERLRLFLGQGLLMALQSLLLLVGTLIILFITNWRLTLVILPILPFALVIFMLFGRMAQPLFREVQQRLSKVNTILQENLAGLQVVKAFAGEPQETARFEISNDDLLEQRIRISRTFSFLFPLVFLVANLGQAAILYFGGVQIVNGTLTLNAGLLTDGLEPDAGDVGGTTAGTVISLMAQASATADRIFEILDTKNDVANRPDAKELAEVRGVVEFDGVTFRYFESGEPVLQDVSFVAEPGQTIALLGSTGSGKTTIINLIPRSAGPTPQRTRLSVRPRLLRPTNSLRSFRKAMVPG